MTTPVPGPLPPWPPEVFDVYTAPTVPEPGPGRVLLQVIRSDGTGVGFRLEISARHLHEFFEGRLSVLKALAAESAENRLRAKNRDRR